jgi:hypothetical protein
MARWKPYVVLPVDATIPGISANFSILHRQAHADHPACLEYREKADC